MWMGDFVDICFGFVMVANAHLIERKDHVFVAEERQYDECSNENKEDAPAPMPRDKEIDIKRSSNKCKYNADDKCGHNLGFNSGNTFEFDGDGCRK